MKTEPDLGYCRSEILDCITPSLVLFWNTNTAAATEAAQQQPLSHAATNKLFPTPSPLQCRNNSEKMYYKSQIKGSWIIVKLELSRSLASVRPKPLRCFKSGALILEEITSDIKGHSSNFSIGPRRRFAEDCAAAIS